EIFAVDRGYLGLAGEVVGADIAHRAAQVQAVVQIQEHGVPNVRLFVNVLKGSAGHFQEVKSGQQRAERRDVLLDKELGARLTMDIEDRLAGDRHGSGDGAAALDDFLVGAIDQRGEHDAYVDVAIEVVVQRIPRQRGAA